ncbi:MAG: acetyl-CoA carboxylase biotin carboxyl carrier protein [Opitutales bacterium]|nr:acetyl-CoA carboxylase biotin carboxyl carrier protein [Opitutales bacterium]
MDLSELKGIISLMQKSDLTDLEIETQDLKLRLARPGESKGQITYHAEPVPVQVSNETSTVPSPQTNDTKLEEDVYIFKSPMVGTFYRKPSPDDPTFVSSGDKITKGDVLCIVEAMKVMNEVQADQGGEIVEIFVEDSVSVEYGQPLFKIRKK